MKKLLIIIGLFISSISYSQSKQDTIAILNREISYIVQQNNQLRQNNTVLNQRVHELFMTNLRLVQDSTISHERIINLLDKK
jgi:FtsZ-binding cell division protein ZapB